MPRHCYDSRDSLSLCLTPSWKTPRRDFPLRVDSADQLRALTAVRGIAFRGEDGAVHRTVPRPHMPDIDSQPWPDRESLDIEQYVRTWREHHGIGSVSLITARGCPYHCRCCSHEVFGKTHRRRKPVSVVDELKWLLNRYHPDMAWLADDVFTIHHGWLYQYAAERYFSVRELCHRFSPHFRLESWKGVGVAVPPSYMEPWAQRFPKVLNLAAYVDQWLGPCPLMRAMSDHVLMTFEHSRA